MVFLVCLFVFVEKLLSRVMVTVAFHNDQRDSTHRKWQDTVSSFPAKYLISGFLGFLVLLNLLEDK